MRPLQCTTTSNTSECLGLAEHGPHSDRPLATPAHRAPGPQMCLEATPRHESPVFSRAGNATHHKLPIKFDAPSPQATKCFAQQQKARMRDIDWSIRRLNGSWHDIQTRSNDAPNSLAHCSIGATPLGRPHPLGQIALLTHRCCDWRRRFRWRLFSLGGAFARGSGRCCCSSCRA